MTSAQPPAAPTWLLNHFDCGPRNDALIGDLLEEYARGRSRAWYWRQVLAAIAVNFGRALYEHPVLALRALAIAWTMFLLTRRIPTLGLLVRLLRPAGHPFSFTLLMVAWFVGVVLSDAVLLAIGWIVARLHRPHRTVMVLLVALSILAYGLTDTPWICTLFLDSFGNARYFPYFAIVAFGIVSAPISVWIGGSLGARREHDSGSQDRQFVA